MRVKMSKQPPPALTASAVGPCPTIIQIVGRPGTGSLPTTIAPPDHPSLGLVQYVKHVACICLPKKTFPIVQKEINYQYLGCLS